MKGKKVLLASFRNEAPFILEFVAHHKVIGFDEVVIASNDCTDGTSEILAALDKAGAIRHVPCYPSSNLSPQAFAYRQARMSLPIDRADWLMILDADEFLNIHIGGRRLEDLISVNSVAPELILINWACFGASGHDRWEDKLTTSLFLRRLGLMNGESQVKCLIHGPEKWRKLSNHHPFGFRGCDNVRVAFAAGLWVEELPSKRLQLGAFRDIRPRSGSFGIAQINHYATRSQDCFHLRRLRGRGSALRGAANERHSVNYFRRLSSGNIMDDTIVHYVPEVAARIAEYRSDPAIDREVAKGLRLYEAEIERYWSYPGDRANSEVGDSF